MGDKVEPRRKWIESHVQFSLEEDGSILEKKADEEAPNSEIFDEEKAHAQNSDSQKENATEISLFEE